MSSNPQKTKSTVTTDFEACKKAFHDAMEKAQTQIAAATAQVNKLRADLKTQSAEAKGKVTAQMDEATKHLDSVRKQQQQAIEANLKAVHADIETTNAELKHATAAAKLAAEAKAKAMREEYDSARRALIASTEAELAEWKTRIDDMPHRAAEEKAALKVGVQAKIADLHAKHDAAQKKLQGLKQANAAAFNELHRGLQSAIAEIKTAVQRARAAL